MLVLTQSTLRSPPPCGNSRTARLHRKATEEVNPDYRTVLEPPENRSRGTRESGGYFLGTVMVTRDVDALPAASVHWTVTV